MKKLLLTGICFISIASSLNASERERDEICCQKMAVAALCGPICACCGCALGTLCGNIAQDIKCRGPLQVIFDFPGKSSMTQLCMQNGSLTETGAVVGCAAGLAGAVAIYKCCFQDMRARKKRNHDD